MEAPLYCARRLRHFRCPQLCQYTIPEPLGIFALLSREGWQDYVSFQMQALVTLLPGSELPDLDSGDTRDSLASCAGLCEVPFLAVMAAAAR